MQPLTRPQSAAMRGLAILVIVLHNFSHWICPTTENEYTYSAEHVSGLLAALARPDGAFPVAMLSFFGHYGVPVFVALSAFGLVMKYENGGKPTPAPQTSVNAIGGGTALLFIWQHYRKLLLMMLTGYVCFVATDRLLTPPTPLSLWCIGGQLSMLGNLWTGLRPTVWPGPYWYFGLMVQLYVVYRLVLFRGLGSIGGRLSERAWTAMAVTLMLVTLLAHWALEPTGAGMSWHRYNCTGSLPVFIAALLWTRRPWGAGASRTAYALAAVVATALVVLLSLTFWTWVLVPFAACAATYALVRCLPQLLLRALAWVGGISAAMFVCHPITRIIFISISREGCFYGGLLLYLLATIVLAILFRKAIAEVTRACTPQPGQH